MKILKISFKSENQLPALMIIEETWEYGQIVWAEAVYVADELPTRLIVDNLVIKQAPEAQYDT